MKKKKTKKLQKIAQIIYNEVSMLQKSEVVMREKPEYSLYDSEVSEKTKQLILSLICYNEGLRITFTEDEFSISIPDITNIKKRQKNTLYNDDNYLEITVSKEGFSFNYAYHKRSYYQDTQMFDELIDTIKQRLIEINRENFTDILSTVLQESGIIRDNNLEQLFNQ